MKNTPPQSQVQAQLLARMRELPTPAQTNTPRPVLQHRADCLRREMAKRQIGACLLFDAVNIRYACGARNMQIFTSRNPASRYLFFPLQGPVILFEFPGCAHLAAGAVVDEIRPAITASAVAAGSAQEEVARRFADEIADLYRTYGGSGQLAIEAATMHHQRALEKHAIPLADAQQAVEIARSQKSAGEIELIKQSIAATDIGVAALREQVRPGASENEMWSFLHQAIIAADGDYIETRLLSSGARTNPWFQESSARVANAGELVGLDTDVVGKYGYYADYSRTFFCGNGKPSARQCDLYKMAVEQVEHNMALLKPGVAFRELAEHAWKIPADCVNNRYFVLAHGVGMTGEYPYIFHQQDFPDAGADGILTPMMTLCVESYLGGADDQEGVKLEQQVLITDSGYELLSTFPYEENLLSREI